MIMLTEKELETFIIGAAEQDVDKLRERGFPIPNNPTLYRQVRLGDYGIVDLLAIGRSRETDKLEIYLYELKRDTVSAADIPQIAKYLGGIDSWLFHSKSVDEDATLKGFLIAPEVDDFLTKFIQPFIHFVSINYSPYDGVRFDLHSFNHFSDSECKNIDIAIPARNTNNNIRPLKQ